LIKPPSLRIALPIAAVLACTLVLAACGTKQDVTVAPGTKPFTVMLDWFPNADHAALYAAIAHGDFRAVGLEVLPQTPAETAEPLKLLAAGKVDMAISYEPELLLARDEGLKLVSIGALVQRPLTSIIAPPSSHIKSVADLAGGRYFPFKNEKDLKTALIALSNDVPNYYVLSFRPSTPTPGIHALQVGTLHRGPFNMNARREYWIDDDTPKPADSK